MGIAGTRPMPQHKDPPRAAELEKAELIVPLEIKSNRGAVVDALQLGRIIGRIDRDQGDVEYAARKELNRVGLPYNPLDAFVIDQGAVGCVEAEDGHETIFEMTTGLKKSRYADSTLKKLASERRNAGDGWCP
jgi:hypothetical protein